MRIGITLENDLGLEGNVCSHFGQCSHFLIVDIENASTKDSKVIVNDAMHGGGGCRSVDELVKRDVTHVISGGMGMGAQQKFQQRGIQIFGYNGKAKDAIDALLKNTLTGIAPCKEHGHDHKHEHNHEHKHEHGGCH